VEDIWQAANHFERRAAGRVPGGLLRMVALVRKCARGAKQTAAGPARRNGLGHEPEQRARTQSPAPLESPRSKRR
jgi:hypothetical protein